MIVINTSKGTLIGENIIVAENFKDKANGLSGKAEPAALFFKTRWGIHTFGVSFPIDCVVCDDSLKVRAIRENLKPNRFFFWSPAYKNVLELPAGTVSATATKIGDVLEFKL